MARQRSPLRDKAFEIWKASGGSKPLVEIAVELGLSDTQIRKWKSQDKWDEKLHGNAKVTLPKKKSNKSNVTNNKGNKSARQPSNRRDEIELDDINSDLTEKQRLFCLFYIKSFNATQSAIKAGYAKDGAHVEGCRLLRKAKIRDEIRRLKGSIQDELFFDAVDVLKVYMQIAFGDITDYVAFGQKEVPVMSMFGPVKDEDGEPLTKTVNYVDLKEINQVDGTLISEIKQSRDGVSIKLHDKMKALEKLEKYVDLLPDRHKRRIEEERLKLDREKFEYEKSLDGGQEGDKVYLIDTSIKKPEPPSKAGDKE